MLIPHMWVILQNTTYLLVVFEWNIRKGVGIRELEEIAGHASIQTTQRYIDVNDEQMRRAAELI